MAAEEWVPEEAAPVAEDCGSPARVEGQAQAEVREAVDQELEPGEARVAEERAEAVVRVEAQVAEAVVRVEAGGLEAGRVGAAGRAQAWAEALAAEDSVAEVVRVAGLESAEAEQELGEVAERRVRRENG